MKQAKKKLTAAIGLGLGVTMLAGAALASYGASSGYDVGKKALKGLLENENYTFDASIKFTLDGHELASSEIRELYDRNGAVKLNRFEKYTSVEAYGSGAEFAEYRQDGDYITVYDNGDGNGDRATVCHNAAEDKGVGALDSMNAASENDRETVNKIVRFAELAADTFVGDLKNNVVYVSGGDNGASYEMNLDSIQIPELVNAGISAMFSSMSQNEGDADDPLLNLGTDPIVKNVSLKFSVDGEGRLTDASANAALVGDGHETAVDMAVNIYDYGSTKPVSVDISTLTNVQEINYSEDGSGIHTYSVPSVEEAEENGYRVNENGEVLDEDDNVVGHVEIDPKTGEGTVVID